MARPMIGHRGAAMSALMAGMEPGLRALFGTRRPVYIATSSATGLMEAAVANLSRRRVLSLVCGAFSERFHRIALARGLDADILSVEWGRPNEPDKVGEALAADPGRYDLVTVVHSETSTGVLNPVREIAAVVREFEDVLIAVDGVSSVGGLEVEFDAWGLDLLLTGSQKALALPPGLALGAVSERALARAREVPRRGLYFDLIEFERRAERHETTTTPAVSLFFALETQLARIAEEGLPVRWARHAAMATRTHAWVEELARTTGRPFSVLAPEGYRSPTVTAIRVPEDVRGTDVEAGMAAHGFTIAAGYGPLRDTTFRIGHMGDHAPDELERLLETLGAVVGRAA